MDTVVKRLYEGLFLVDSAMAASDWNGVVDTIQKMLSRAEADVVSLRKWDERKLAYDIRGRNRGMYILVYFNCNTLKISGIERDVQLSEKVMRVMILRTDKMSKEDIEKATPATIAEQPSSQAAGAGVSPDVAPEAPEAAGTGVSPDVAAEAPEAAGTGVSPDVAAEVPEAADAVNIAVDEPYADDFEDEAEQG